MANATPSRIGQVNSTGGSYANDTALFLKVFAGEVLTAFDETQVMKDRITTRTISSGKSAQFPATWKAAASYHTPGTELNGSNQIKAAEKVINIDGLLLSDVFISNYEEAMNHYDVRAEYSHQLGQALANQYDKTALQTAVLAARQSALITGGFGGSQISQTGMDTDGEIIASNIFAAAQKLDEKDVGENDRFGVFRPAQYYLMAQSVKLINKDWGGSGVYADGKILRVAGVELVKSNHLPSTVVSAATGENNTYNGDFTKTFGFVGNKQVVGCVKLLDLAMESEYQIWRQGTLMVAKYALGMGELRREAAIELKTP